jgi:hypothetical protein
MTDLNHHTLDGIEQAALLRVEEAQHQYAAIVALRRQVASRDLTIRSLRAELELYKRDRRGAITQ